MVRRIWDDFLTEQDKAVFAASGYGSRAGFGTRPVLLVIDINYNFVGDRPQPILESIARWPNSCGEKGWTALPVVAKVISHARKKSLPVIYTTGEVRSDRWDRGSWSWKNSRTSKKGPGSQDTNLDPNDIIPDVKPGPQDIVIKKLKPSAFYGTNLEAFLTLLQADSLLIVGTTTSGCVRATVLDAFSANYRVSIIEDGCFDRSDASHAINLCDMNAKYADVIHSSEVLDYISGLEEGLFELPAGNS